jgi:hypothetical protein
MAQTQPLPLKILEQRRVPLRQQETTYPEGRYTMIMSTTYTATAIRASACLSSNGFASGKKSGSVVLTKLETMVSDINVGSPFERRSLTT